MVENVFVRRETMCRKTCNKPRKRCFSVMVALLLILGLFAGCGGNSDSGWVSAQVDGEEAETEATQEEAEAEEEETEAEAEAEEETEEADGASASNSGSKSTSSAGGLYVDGTQLKDASGNAIQLRGISTHGIGWFPEYVNEAAFQTLRDTWGVNLIRLAMYSAEGAGYCTGGDQSSLKATIDTGVTAATNLGMYVIIDWHILSDGNPLTYESQAVEFFNEMSAKYASNTNVIYEICNEPNGSSWSDIKSYAETVIPVIRANDPDAVILVGTPNWSQYVDEAAANPLSFDNIMYTVHFYAATHKDDLRNRVTTALNGGLPIFVSEFSVCDASGNGGIDYDSANAWKDLINSNNLSYAAWSLCNKNETSALISSSVSATSGWTEADLSDAGKWVMSMISQ